MTEPDDRRRDDAEDRQDEGLSRSEMLDVLEPWVTECPKCGGKLAPAKGPSGQTKLCCLDCGEAIRW